MVEIDYHEVPLTSLKPEPRRHLSHLLNPPKLLFSDGPDKLPRYWEGMACLLGIPTEEALSYKDNQMTKVFDYWILKKDGSATVGRLFEYLQRIDRYDAFDDLMDFASQGTLIDRDPQGPQDNQIAIPANNQMVATPEDTSANSLITFDDKIHGAPQCYHAFVLYANVPKDREFVDQLLLSMREKGLKLCTEDDLLPEFSTKYAPIANLISSDRVYKIVLVYTPAFLNSPANTFYMNYAQAVGIEMRRPKIVPIMLEECTLPAQMAFYHKLYVPQRGGKPAYDVFDRLGYSLASPSTRPNCIGNGFSTTLSAMNITEVSMRSDQGYSTGANGLLALPSSYGRSRSTNNVDDTQTVNISNVHVNGHGHDTKSAGSVKKSKKFKWAKNPMKKLYTTVIRRGAAAKN